MPRNLLPRLRQAPNPANVPLAKVGEWTDLQTPGELAKLDYGVLPDEDVRTRVQSIPSPWARLLLFRAALDDPGHPARRLVENELLDAFQFLWSRSERPGVRLETATVRVEELEDVARETGQQRAEWFGRALRELLPRRDGAGVAPAFETMTIFLVNGRPTIATSPYTVLFTAEDAVRLSPSEAGTFFRYAGNGETRTLARRPFAFQRYVAQVLVPQLDQLATTPAPNTDGAAVQRLLRRWLVDELRACQREARTEQRREALTPPANGAWQSAASALELDRMDGVAGDVQLFFQRAGAQMRESRWMLRPSRQGIARPPLVLDRESFDSRYLPDSPPVRLDGSLADHPSREVLPGTATSYPWVSPLDDWFTDRLLLLTEPLKGDWPSAGAVAGPDDAVYGFSGAGRFTSQYAGPERHLRVPHVALPFTPEILRYFTPEDLERRLSIEVQPTGVVVVTLRLPIGPDGAELPVRRRYDAASVVRVRGPELAIWPSFRSPRWRDYLLFQQDPPGQPIRPLQVDGVADGELLASTEEQRSDTVYVTAFERAPEAIVFRDAIGGGAAKVLGLVLPRYLEAGAPVPQRWEVGVDFGTSNTVISRRVGGNEPEILGAPRLTLALTQPTDAARRNADAHFFPPALDARPFGTAVVRQRQLPNLDMHAERVGVRVNVPFHGFVEPGSRNRVVGDLKWSTDQEQHFLTAAFLRHTLAVVLAEAIRDGVDPRRVDVTWSYPRAFTAAQRNQLDALWQQVRRYWDERLRDTADVQGGAPNVGQIARGPDESRATLRYFFNAQELTAAGHVNVVVDVGGGTSDIAMYGSGRVLALDSVMLGGRNLTGRRDQAGSADRVSNLFVSRFVNWSEQHQLANSPDEAAAVRKYREDGQDHLAFSYLLRSRWFELHGRPFAGHQACHRFQGAVLYFYGALFHYMGLSLRSLAAEGTNAAEFVPAVVKLAGNGSRYVDWLTDLVPDGPGRAEAFRPFADFFGRTLVHAMGLDGAGVRLPEIRLSIKPKLEVALGLVAKVDLQGLREDGAACAPLIGERVRVPLGDDSTPRTLGALSRLDAHHAIEPGAVAHLSWESGPLEIQRYHDHFVAQLKQLGPQGAQWGENHRLVSALFDRLDATALQQRARTLLSYLASRHHGFHGSLFLVEAGAVLDTMMEDWFTAPGAPLPTPTISHAAVSSR
jgi:hypothetical protein